MAPTRIALALGSIVDRPFAEIERLARLADELGYEALFVPEAWGRDAFVTLGALARITRRVALGTGIVNVYSRTPALLAMAAATLDEVSGGRAILGLGTSGRRVIEGWHGIPMLRPRRRLRETTEAVRAALGGSRRGYDGETVRVAPGFALTLPHPRERIPILHASLTPAAIRQCAQIADGWLPYFASPASLERDLVVVADGLRDSGRERSSFTVAPFVPVIATDGDPSASRALMRRHLAFYLGGMGEFYRDTVARHGFAASAAEVRRRWEAREREAAAAAVSDEMLDAFTAIGDAGRCRERLEGYRAAGADLPVVAVPADAGIDAVEHTVRALAP